jgi:hypothetical protein
MEDPVQDVLGNKELRAQALRVITDAIDPAAHEGLMEIELLPQSMFPPGISVLRDGYAVAINKSSLRAAYIDALEDLRQTSYVSIAARQLLVRDTVVQALKTLAVVLLLQPEHLMAVNLRKSLLTRVSLEQIGVRNGTCDSLWQLEMRFIDSLLTSPLNKHNKSPTLWAHRRFVFDRVSRLEPTDVMEDLKRVVMVAAEKHPRNYYAWNHALYLVQSADARGDAAKQGILEAVLDWCKRHHDDISGWSFLQTLLSTDCRYEAQTVRHVFQDVLTLASRLRWTNESVWVFLRTMAARGVLGDQEYREFLQTAAALEAGTEDRTAQRVLQAAAAWCARYRQH